ncbi:hypothetical protein KPH14_012729 [Odynerus spinipes]|uniref:Uncharacterized protein n=1 Tax=Odynerus spinipes TaxID=1348599 RepID=A0AAD9VL48_9HYME|nr:hypothetical protein KPH14_012729 [Odynerus spinipes]
MSSPKEGISKPAGGTGSSQETLPVSSEPGIVESLKVPKDTSRPASPVSSKASLSEQTQDTQTSHQAKTRTRSDSGKSPTTELSPHLSVAITEQAERLQILKELSAEVAEHPEELAYSEVKAIEQQADEIHQVFCSEHLRII